MPPPDLTSRPAASSALLPLEEALATQDWSDLSRRLTKYAHFRLRGRSWETAEEIAQEAIARVLDPAYASWDRTRHPDLFDCLGSVVNGLVANHRKRKAHRARHVALRDDDAAHDDEEPEVLQPGEEEAPPPPADAVILKDERTAEGDLGEARRGELAIAALRARLAGNALLLGLLDLIASRVGSAAAQAEALGVTVSEVYTAKRRLMEHTRAVGRELARGGES